MQITFTLAETSDRELVALRAMISTYLDGEQTTVAPMGEAWSFVATEADPEPAPLTEEQAEVPEEVADREPEPEPPALDPLKVFGPAVLAAEPAPPAPPAPPAVDVHGLPWDARIHSSGRAMNGDGSWRMKRGVADTLVQRVTQELRGPVTAAEPAQAPPPPPPPGPPPPQVNPFVAMMQRVTAMQSAGKLTQLDVNNVLQQMGLAQISGLMGRPELIAEFGKKLEAFNA